jgi:2-C-methyl-D-erythritol 4-phosphate cytidylyltransferase
MASFSVILLTAPPPGLASEGEGALTRVDGKEALLRSAELFVTNAAIKQILVVFPAEQAEEAKKRFGAHFSFAGIKVATGGPRWLDQAAAGLEKLAGETTHVLVHDGARCCVPHTDIDRVIEETSKLGATEGKSVGLVSPVRSTLVELDEGGSPVGYRTPGGFAQLLGPQGYTRKAFEELAKRKQEIHPSNLRTVRASPLNARVGGSGDERLIKAMIGLLPRPQKKVDGPFQEAQW